MNKIIISVFIMLSCCTLAKSQSAAPSKFEINALAVGTLSNYYGDDITGNTPIIRGNLGLRASYEILSSLRLETGFEMKKFGTLENDDNVKTLNTLSYFQIPAMLRYSFKKFSLGVGMQVNFLNNAEIKITDTDDPLDIPFISNYKQKINTKGQYDKSTYSYCLDFKYTLNSFHALGISYTYNPNKILINDFDWKVSSFQIYYSLNLVEVARIL
jgi:hypothetical protein